MGRILGCGPTTQRPQPTHTVRAWWRRGGSVTRGDDDELEQRWWHAAYPVSSKATTASGPG
jgi:hypothetical protein